LFSPRFGSKDYLALLGVPEGGTVLTKSQPMLRMDVFLFHEPFESKLSMVGNKKAKHFHVWLLLVVVADLKETSYHFDYQYFTLLFFSCTPLCNFYNK
jgi:hypothetical protein